MSANYFSIFGNNIPSNDIFGVLAKYRYGDRYQSVRELQHSVNPSNRQVPNTRVFFEIGPEYVIATSSENDNGYKTDISVSNFDINTNIDIMLNPNLFIFGNTILYRRTETKTKYNWLGYTSKDEHTQEFLFAYYSLGFVGYPYNGFKIEGSMEREKTSYYDDWWYFEEIYINGINISGAYLNAFDVHGLSFGLGYSRYFGLEISPQSEFLVTLSYRFGDRDKNVRNLQHRVN